MELYAKGQLSYLILNILRERDFYGLDIITEISSRSKGNINLKKPSVYSNLTRMESQGYVSSYLKNSDLGPNRKYYSITEKGRNFYNELSDYFNKNNIDVFASFSDGEQENISEDIKEEQPVAEKTSESNSNSPAQDDDYFDFSDLNDDNNKTEETNENQIEENIETEIEKSPIEEKHEETKESAEETILSENVSDYNKKIYDISKDINNYKRKRSFAEDQISINISSPLSSSNEKTRNNIEELKNSFNETKAQRIDQYDFSKQMSYSYNTAMANRYFNQNKEEEKIEEEPAAFDDAKYITDRIETAQRARKIEPPRLKILEPQVKADSLPAPKRDTSIDPSHKEILSKLYSKTKDNSHGETRNDAIYDYSDLKDYYSTQNIAFNEYTKSFAKHSHNTNKLYLIISILSFLILTISTTIAYIILFKTNQLQAHFNFLYIVLPALLLIDIGIKYYNYKKYQGWLPSQMLSPWKMWVLTFILLSCIIVLNAILGLGVKPFSDYSTTIILPCLMVLSLLPARYYLKRTILVKYWR